MKIHQLSIDEALRSVSSTTQGLSPIEAERRFREYGPNRIEQVVRRPAALRLLSEFFRLFSLILWAAAALAFIADRYSPGEGMANVAYALVAVIGVSGLFSFWQEYRIERTLAALQKLLPQTATGLRGGSIVELPVEQIVVGDILLLDQGDHVPADCRLIEAFRVAVDTATITGETASRSMTTEASAEEDPLRSRNTLLAGTSIVSGRCKAVVFAIGRSTEFGRIAHLAQTAAVAPSPLQKQLVHLSRWIAILSVVVGLSFFAVGALVGVPVWQDILFSIGVIVAMVPEGLLPTLTLALVLAAQRMARLNVLVRQLTSVETLGFATVICTDKTGTLTENRMQARELLLGLQLYPVADVREIQALRERYGDLFVTAGTCHDLTKTRNGETDKLLGDPMEIALVDLARSVLPQLPDSRRLDEIPFDSDRKRHSVVHETPQGRVLYCKGALESVLPLCAKVTSEEGIRALDSDTRAAIRVAEDRMALQGLRVIALASRILGPSAQQSDVLERELVFLGLAGLEDPPRPEVAGAIRKCREAGIAVIMVTGDHALTAAAVAREIGLTDSAAPRAVSGQELSRMSLMGLQLALDAGAIIFARVTPEQKMRIVQALIAKKHVVAVTGDGVNDAPALKAAHIGIAMGVTGTDVAKESADMILMDDNFASIVNAVEEGRALFENIRKFLTYVLVHNVAELVPYLAFALLRIPLPLTPIQALFIDMGTDSLTALGLGAERPVPQRMRLPPRSQDERLLNLPLATRAYLFLGLIEAAAAMSAFFFVLQSAGWRYGEVLGREDPLYLQATTACLCGIIVMQILNVFLCRSSVRSVFSLNPFDNRLILWGVVLELALLLIAAYSGWGSRLLGTAAIPPTAWLLLVPFAVAMLVLEELRKWLVRGFLRARAAARSPRD